MQGYLCTIKPIILLIQIHNYKYLQIFEKNSSNERLFFHGKYR